MKKVFILGLVLAILAILAVPMAALASDPTTVYVYKLQPDWTAPGGGGVYSAYYLPGDQYTGYPPGTTAVYDGREAGIIKAGLATTNPALDPPWDQGLFGFKPTVTIDELAAGPLNWVVENQYGENPVWMTIEIDTGMISDRHDNMAYQFVPTTNPAIWHTVDAATGQWQLMDDNGNGVGLLMSLSQVAALPNNSGRNVVRAYLRLGMGDSYHGSAGLGTIAWIDKATIGDVTYDFVVNPTTQVSGTVVAPSVEVTAPTAINLGTLYLGLTEAHANGWISYDSGSGSYTGWSLTAQDPTTDGRMWNGGNYLTDKLQVSVGNGYGAASSPCPALTGSASGSFTLYASQTLVAGDSAGIYSITITVTGSVVL